jgi:hypothetical protein
MKTVYLFLFIVLIACNSQSNSNKRFNKEIKNVAKNNTLCNTYNEKNDFELFYSKFISDSIFQKSHIKFPLKNAISECDTTITLTEKNWHFDSNDIRKYDKTIDRLIVKEGRNEFHFIIERIDVGILYKERFMKINNIWYLVYYFVNAC